MEPTINAVFKNRSQKYGSRIAVEKKTAGAWISASWAEYYERARAVGLGLFSLGVAKGDRVSILSENRLEWLYADMGSLGIGACVIPIYTTLVDEEVSYIISNSDSKVLIVENRVQLEKALYAKKECSTLQKIILMEEKDVPPGVNDVMSLKELMDQGRKKFSENAGLFEELADAINPDDIATIVYTSGTTGVPKGAMISHRNIMSVCEQLHAVRPQYASESDQTVPFLPLSHVFERIAGHFYGMYVGVTASYAQSLDTLLADFADKRPTMILAVPRVCEKVYHKIIAQVQQSSPLKQAIFRWGQRVGAQISKRRELKKPIQLRLRLEFKIAYTMIFKKLQEKLGGRVTWMTASGAPTAEEIIRFFNAAGITVIQGYGMTECTAPATMQTLDNYRIGTAGPPLPGMQVKIADDGEILVKGDNVIKGYWKMPEETQDAFTPDGFFMSGDIGYFDDEGNLLITDRKKDLIITSGGKNVAPQKIENLFKGDPLFTQFIVVGDQRKYLTALCNINLEQAVKIAGEQSISYRKPEDLLTNESFLAVVQRHFDGHNTHLARYETIKKFRVIEKEFSQEGGELTPSLKVKRKMVQQKYIDIIDTMYAADTADDLNGSTG